jgi:cytochrome d ubiquinol oxidase subunit I
MRTADASSNHSFMQMSITLIMFVVVYFALFGAGLGYMMRLVRKGPKIAKAAKRPTVVLARNTPARPLSAADDGSDDDHIQHKGH